jgi:hypothetical protein
VPRRSSAFLGVHAPSRLPPLAHAGGNQAFGGTQRVSASRRGSALSCLWRLRVRHRCSSNGRKTARPSADRRRQPSSWHRLSGRTRGRTPARCVPARPPGGRVDAVGALSRAHAERVGARAGPGVPEQMHARQGGTVHRGGWLYEGRMVHEATTQKVGLLLKPMEAGRQASPIVKGLGFRV